jgi:hypothetical protein
MELRTGNIRRLSLVFSICILLLFFNTNCNKLVQVPNPISSVTANQVFSSDATATSTMLGIYSYMDFQQSFSNSLATAYLGESADDLIDQTPGFESADRFLSNNLTTAQSSGQVSSFLWQPAYYDIYCANAVIAGIATSNGITAPTASQLTGEAKFIRAFCYFYLTNLFGNVPLDLSIDFNETVLLSESSQLQVYQQIISDLYDAQNLMIGDFSLTSGQPIRANRWAATALLARVYLYQGQWASADSAATAVINSGLFRLVGLDSVFLANSNEAILQLQTVNNFPYATLEGNTFIPYDSNSYATYWLTPQLLGAFEPGDQRRADWVDSTNPQGLGTYYYYPYKYKVKVGSSWPVTENYMLLRLAEQYLIRAEAEAEPGSQQNLPQAVADVNLIRARAGLPALSTGLSQSQILDSVQHEKRVEFFAEWGHRWLDLKRWGIAIQTLDTISYKKPNIDSTQLLYPIPMAEIQTDPNLKQNRGYN